MWKALGQSLGAKGQGKDHDYLLPSCFTTRDMVTESHLLPCHHAMMMIMKPDTHKPFCPLPVFPPPLLPLGRTTTVKFFIRISIEVL